MSHPSTSSSNPRSLQVCIYLSALCSGHYLLCLSVRTDAQKINQYYIQQPACLAHSRLSSRQNAHVQAYRSMIKSSFSGCVVCVCLHSTLSMFYSYAPVLNAVFPCLPLHPLVDRRCASWCDCAGDAGTEPHWSCNDSLRVPVTVGLCTAPGT